MSSSGLGKDYAPGEVVVRQGQTGDCMFAIQKGRMEVLKNENGREVRIAIIGEGEIFGEMAIFEKEVRSATVRALGPARVLTVDKKTFLRRVQEDPSLAVNLLQMMSHRIRKLSVEVADLRAGVASAGPDALPASETPAPPGDTGQRPGIDRAVVRGARQPRPDTRKPDAKALPVGAPLELALVQPEQVVKTPPCSAACASGADVRGWIALVAQRGKLGLSDTQACTAAWNRVAAVNPLPATLGRICPHPCESSCNRSDKDGAVSINALERFLGDWGLQRRLRLPKADQGDWKETVGVIGSGPAGLSFAYQMARRGYRVTVYERQDRPGGMLYFGIPQYRLPEAVLEAEIRRILDLGVELRLNTVVGSDVALQELRESHHCVFVGIGAGLGRRLGIPGESGAGMWTGTDFLAQVNCGKAVDLGRQVAVVGGGNTAMDAARAARRTGAQVTVVYRRSRIEMPAIESEVRDALDEGVEIMCLAAPVAIRREDGAIRSVRIQRMTLGEPDSSGRRKPVPVLGAEQDIAASSVIAAVSQATDWSGLEALRSAEIWIRRGASGWVDEGLWLGGDALGPGVAGLAIAQGRRAAEATHAQLRGLPESALLMEAVKASARTDFFPPAPRAVESCRSVASRLRQPDVEVRGTMSEQQFFDEAARCFSCGSCFGCEHCYMFCNGESFSKLQEPGAGRYFSLSLDRCEACGKCIEVCPSGYLSVRAATTGAVLRT